MESLGNSFSLLVDSGSTHSFISPSMVAKLGVNPISTGKRLRASLANGTKVLIEEKIVDLKFTLEGHASSQIFRVMKMGKFEGILGMDWLREHNADIHCKQGTISFQIDSGEIVHIQGKQGKAPLRVVKAAKLVKGLKKGLSIYLLKLNDLAKKPEGKEPEWMSEYQDVFPEELTELPPSRGLEHEIELEPRSRPCGKGNLQDVSARSHRVERVVNSSDRARIYPTQCFSVGRSHSLPKEERWDILSVHRF